MTPLNEPGGELPHDWHNRWLRRHWPPDNQMPAILPVQQILGRSEAVMVVLREVVVYTSGLNFYVTLPRLRGRCAVVEHIGSGGISRRFDAPMRSWMISE